jgi:AraC family transcriptional regulator
MNAVTNIQTKTGTSSDLMLYQRGQTPRPVSERTAAPSRATADVVAIEAVRLLKDVRLALDCDIKAAAGAAARLLELLTANISQEALSGRVHNKLPQWKMRKVDRYIDDHIEAPIMVADLARLVSLSAGYFCRAFKANIGEAPHSYIMRAKIKRAQAMMLTTTVGLSQIALACGFADQSHLCRCFRQVTGTTPAVWRRTHAGEAETTALMDRINPARFATT